MGSAVQKTFDAADETRTFDKGKLDVVNLATHTAARAIFDPGWKWSTSVKPVVGTDSCQGHHVGYVIAGSLHVVMDDGSELDTAPGTVYEIQPGHDAWVVGDEKFVALEFQTQTAREYAKP